MQLLTIFEDESNVLMTNAFSNSALHDRLVGINLSTRFNAVSEKNLRCFSCKYTAEPTREPLKGMLQLDFVQGAATSNLHDMLSNYCDEEQVGDYICGECGKLGETRKSCNMDTAPSELFLHMKRFKSDDSGQHFSKISVPVYFPEILKFSDCRRFPRGLFTDAENYASDANLIEYNIHPDYSGILNKPYPSSFGELLKSQVIASLPLGAFEYRLSAVIRHFGQSIEGGHYYADVFNNSDHLWRRFNDFSDPVVIDKVLNCI